MKTKDRFSSQATEYIKTIPVDGWTIQKIPSTVESAYLSGCSATDEAYREAIMDYCNATGQKFADVFPQILKFLTK